MPSSLAAAFVAALPPDADAPAPSASLEAALSELIARAAVGWPAVDEHADAFAAFVAERLRPERAVVEQLSDLCAADLALAWACVAEQPGAIAAFEARHGATMHAVAVQYAGDDIGADDVVQGIRERLFVRDGGTLAGYRGRGALHKWVLVAVRRAGLDYVRARGRRHEVDADEAKLDARVGELDPELDYIKQAYRETFAEALTAALASLKPRQRNVLRHRLVYGVRVDEIAAIYGVNRKTITRWIAAANEDLLRAVKQRVRTRLKISSDELNSLMTLVRSRLDFSLGAALRSTTSLSGEG